MTALHVRVGPSTILEPHDLGGKAAKLTRLPASLAGFCVCNVPTVAVDNNYGNLCSSFLHIIHNVRVHKVTLSPLEASFSPYKPITSPSPKIDIDTLD